MTSHEYAESKAAALRTGLEAAFPDPDYVVLTGPDRSRENLRFRVDTKDGRRYKGRHPLSSFGEATIKDIVATVRESFRRP